MGRVEDIGHAAVFLASPLASYISGCMVVVDGGQNLAGSTMFNLGAAQVLDAQERKDSSKLS
jgi:enoyl-[acyl-carrier-protein] reductase (NADH)